MLAGCTGLRYVEVYFRVREVVIALCTHALQVAVLGLELLVAAAIGGHPGACSRSRR